MLKIEEEANNLMKRKSKLDTDKMKPPAFLILTGTDAYKRKDGIYIVPISCLKN